MIASFEQIWRYTPVNGIPCETVGTEVEASPFTAAFCEVPTNRDSNRLIQNTGDPHRYNLENLQKVLAKKLGFFFCRDSNKCREGMEFKRSASCFYSQ